LRDVRRLVVAMSRARLGLYIFGRRSLFEQCYELTPTFSQLIKRPTSLELVSNEVFPTTRQLNDEVPSLSLPGVLEMGGVLKQYWQEAERRQTYLAALEQQAMQEWQKQLESSAAASAAAAAALGVSERVMADVDVAAAAEAKKAYADDDDGSNVATTTSTTSTTNNDKDDVAVKPMEQ